MPKGRGGEIGLKGGPGRLKGPGRLNGGRCLGAVVSWAICTGVGPKLYCWPSSDDWRGRGS